MARSISVKIPTSALISQIESKIAEIDTAIANYPAQREQYERDVEAYKTKVIEFISDYLNKNSRAVGYDYNSVIRISQGYNSRFDLTFDTDSIEGFPTRPTEPKKPNQQEWFGREHATQKQLLERNLKILKMTSQEEVNASTYGAVMELL